VASCCICVFILFSDHSLQNTCERQSKRDNTIIRIVSTRNPVTGKCSLRFSATPRIKADWKRTAEQSR
jgi:hypothetical protein